jgi:hypothetical protein
LVDSVFAAAGTGTSVGLNVGSGKKLVVAGTQTLAGENMTPYTAFKNRIINGAMVIDQRNAGASVTPTDGQYTLDRFMARVSQASKLTVQQNAGSVTPPAGFKNYLGVTVAASANVTVGASDYFNVQQRIEGFNTSDLDWGTANAQTVTLSFWVRSSLTGTFGGTIINSAANYSYPFSYTISAANTWEQKSVTIAGPTAGTWIGATNGIGMMIYFSVGTGTTVSGTAGSWSANTYLSATGAVKLIETNSATFYITGVQLEKGSTATSFDYRPYGTELALCQRYYELYDGTTIFLTKLRENTRDRRASFYYKVTKRASATLTIITSNADGGGAVAGSSGIDGGNFESLSTADGQTPLLSKFSGSAEL